MKTTSASWALATLLLHTAMTAAGAAEIPAGASGTPAAKSALASQPAEPTKGAEVAALERKMLGSWRGGPCVGTYTFHADGSYELHDFTPSRNSLTGTWSVRWDALPPTLLITCKTSDFKARDANGPEYKNFGVPLEAKLVELNDDAIVIQFPAYKQDEDSKGYSERYQREVEK